MEDKIVVSRIETRENRKEIKKESKDDPRGTPSPPSKFVILSKKPQKTNITLLTKSIGDQPNQNAVPTVYLAQPQHAQNSQNPSANLPVNSIVNNEETVNELLANVPSTIKLIDESLLFQESPANDYLLNESLSSKFSVITAVGLQNVGKSSLLNRIAGKNIFKTHRNGQNDLKHLTKGIDLHVTKERLLLLDSQPLLSASVLDDYLKNTPSSVVNICEPENYAFMASLQLLSFLFATCDYVIIMSDWMVDIHLIKLITTAIMMVGDGAQKANLIWYFNKKNPDFKSNAIELLLGRGLSFNVICKNENQLLNAVMKLPSNKLIGEGGNTRNTLHISEKSWLNSSKSIWENICKQSLFSDYGHFLP